MAFVYFRAQMSSEECGEEPNYKLRSIAYGKFIAFGFCVSLLTWRIHLLARTHTHSTAAVLMYLIEWSAKCGERFLFCSLVRLLETRDHFQRRSSEWHRLDSLKFLHSVGEVEFASNRREWRKARKKLTKSKNAIKTVSNCFLWTFFCCYARWNGTICS